MDRWALDCKPSSLRPITRVSLRNGCSVFAPFSAVSAGSCPLALAGSGEPLTPGGLCILPICDGDVACTTAAHRRLLAVACTPLFGPDYPSELVEGETQTALRRRWESHPVCRGDRELQYMPASPQHLDWIMCEHWIMADERCLFSIGLSDQQPVKGVLVIRWQALQGEDMTEGGIHVRRDS